ncbi:MAG: hypothetical protein AAGL89_09565 [Pseudomonadota bacterium]
MQSRHNPSDLAEVVHSSFTVRMQVHRGENGSTEGWIATVIDNRTSDQWVFNSIPGLMNFFASRSGDTRFQISEAGYE